MSIRKIVKFLFIFVAILIIGVVVYVSFEWWAFNSLSYDEKINTFVLAHKKCLAKNGDNCEEFLLKGTAWMIYYNLDKEMEIVLDSSKSVEQRISSLENFSSIIRLNKAEKMSKQESDFYYEIAFNKENPVKLREKAHKFLISNSSDDLKIIKIQQQAIKENNSSPQQIETAINALSKAELNNSADFFIEILKKSGDFPRVNAGQALINMNAKDNIPDLMDIALDKTFDVSNRAIALSTIKGILVKTKIDDNDLLITELKQLLDDEKYSIRINATEIMELITGEKYNIEQASEEEFNEYLSETYFENMLIQGIDY